MGVTDISSRIYNTIETIFGTLTKVPQKDKERIRVPLFSFALVGHKIKF